MFRGYLSLSAAVLALLCVAGMPGQLYAQRGGGSRSGVGPQVGRSSPGFDRRFVGSGFGGFDRGFGGFNRGGAGGFNSAAFAAYRNCLKLHGVTLPTPGAKPTAGSTTSTTTAQSNSTFQAAEQACAALRPTASTTTTTS